LTLRNFKKIKIKKNQKFRKVIRCAHTVNDLVKILKKKSNQIQKFL